MDLPARLDMGLHGDGDGDDFAANGSSSSNGHTNGSSEDSIMGDGNEAEREAQAAAGLRRVPTD